VINQPTPDHAAHNFLSSATDLLDGELANKKCSFAPEKSAYFAGSTAACRTVVSIFLSLDVIARFIRKVP